MRNGITTTSTIGPPKLGARDSLWKRQEDDPPCGITLIPKVGSEVIRAIYQVTLSLDSSNSTAFLGINDLLRAMFCLPPRGTRCFIPQYPIVEGCFSPQAYPRVQFSEDGLTHAAHLTEVTGFARHNVDPGHSRFEPGMTGLGVEEARFGVYFESQWENSKLVCLFGVLMKTVHLLFLGGWRTGFRVLRTVN